ncbi:alpha/beta hydrolase [Clostridium sp. B9]|uniref:alpha/beta hydrolase n=1 Tax=Clostridium sp. B9 TaxID=3423224 RepID=UPI003D2F2CC5
MSKLDIRQEERIKNKWSKAKKWIGGILAIVVIVTISAIGFGGNYLYNLALNPDTPKDMIFASTESNNDVVTINGTSGPVSISSQKWLLEQSGYEDFYMTSRDGLKLHNYLIKKPNTNKWAITVHGYTSEGKLTASYAKNFFDMGYNVIIPDLRGHGSSEGDYIGMGWDERIDIIDLINYIIKEDSDAEIVLFGVSMGASTVMNVSGEKLPSNVKAIIADCGYTSVWDEFAYQLKELFGLPPFPMLYVANIITRVRAGYWINGDSSIGQVSKSNTPTLFIQGDKDTFVPAYMVDELYNASSAPKKKLIIEGAGHAKSNKVDPQLYWQTIDKYLNKYVN